MKQTRRLPAEWEPHSAVLAAWPNNSMDWADTLASVQACVAAIIRELSQETTVVLAAADPLETGTFLQEMGVSLDNIRLYGMPLNDTWARDFGPITVLQTDSEGEKPLLLDWVFNGWGMKFAAHYDNMVTRRLSVAGAFGATAIETVAHVLEGGSIESDGQGTLLTTAQCLLDYNRNPDSDITDIERMLCEKLGVQRVLWLHHGRLTGDDTDSHIDTLVRFCDPFTIAYTRTDDSSDEHFSCLQQMQEELETLRTADGQPYRLIPLPLPSAIYDDEGNRLPATYANFLITDHSVWVPQYGVTEDAAAFSTMIGLFPGRTIRGVDCLPLIQQHGSLHCITMQLPAGVVPEEV